MELKTFKNFKHQFYTTYIINVEYHNYLKHKYLNYLRLNLVWLSV